MGSLGLSISINEENLYNQGVIVIFNNGEEALLRVIVDYTPKEGDKYHVVKESDELTKLAGLFYGRSIQNAGKYWWVIADANRIHNPLDLTELVGTEIVIPDLLNLKLAL